MSTAISQPSCIFDRKSDSMKRFLIVLLMILALTLTACGTADSDDTTPSDTGGYVQESSSSYNSETVTTETEHPDIPEPPTTEPSTDAVAYLIGNLSFDLPKNTDVSVDSTIYSFPVVPDEAFLVVNIHNVSELDINSANYFVTLAQQSFTQSYDKIGASDVSMEIAGFSATGETFSVQEDGHFYRYHVMSFTDTYYVYTFMYMTRSDVSDSTKCTLAYGDLIGNIEYIGSAPRSQ